LTFFVFFVILRGLCDLIFQQGVAGHEGHKGYTKSTMVFSR